MKKTLKKFAGIVLILLSVTAITKGQEPNMSDWKELNEFHDLMAKTYHPMSEKGDYTPIHNLSAELALKAKVLAASKVPATYSNPAVQKLVQKIAADADIINKMVQEKVSDEKIKVALTDLHTSFHKLIEMKQKEAVKTPASTPVTK